MKFQFHRTQHDSPMPILESARMRGNPRSWPSEKLERLLTPRELDQVLHHRT